MVACLFVTMSFSIAFAGNNDEKLNSILNNKSNNEIHWEPEQKTYSLNNIPKSNSSLFKNNIIPNDRNISKSPSMYRAKRRSQDLSFNGTIDQEEEFAWLYPIQLEPKQIIQANLICPNNPNLDYDLYLFEYDEETGSIVGDIVAFSTYGTYFNTYPDGISKTLDESIGHVNKSDVMKSYAIGVYAKVGCSATDEFQLNVSFDGPILNENGKEEYPYEMNESQNANNIFGEINTNTNVTGGKINSVNDNDWFKLTIPSDFSMYAENLKIDLKNEKSSQKNTFCTTELYYTTDGASMILVPKNNLGNYSVGNNGIANGEIYYLRVIPSDTFVSYTKYDLTTSAKRLAATNVVLTGFNSPQGPDSYVTLAAFGKGYWIEHDSKWISVTGYAVNENNYVVPDAYINAEWSSGGWNQLPDDDEIFGNRKAYTWSEKDGSFTVTIDGLPPAQGTRINNGSVYASRFDIDKISVWTSSRSNEQIITFYHSAGIL